MKIGKYFFGSLIVLLAVVFIYSCDREHVPDASSQDILVQSRLAGSDCSPEILDPGITDCVHDTISKTINFSGGHSLYSNGSTLYQICPGVTFTVTYFFSVCTLAGKPVHIIHNLNYNLADIIAACPALQAVINDQMYLGNLVSFLDLLDFDISKQVEFTEVYDAALSSITPFYPCDMPGNFYSIKYIQFSCYQWVPYTDIPIDRPRPSYKKEECAGSICCIRTGHYCLSHFYEGEPVLFGSGDSSFARTEGVCPVNCLHDCGSPNPCPECT